MQTPESALTNIPPFEPRLAPREVWQDEIASRRHIGEVALSNLQEPLTVKNLEKFEDESRAYDAVINLILSGSQTEEEVAAMMEHIEFVEKAALGDRPEVTGNPFLEDNADKIPPLIDTKLMVMADPMVQEIINSRDISESHQRLLEAWPRFRGAYTEGVKRGVELGYIPKSAEDRLEAALTKTSVRVSDATVLDAYGPMSAYYRNDHDEIGVRHDIHESGEGFHDNLAHEFTHKLSGGTFKSPEVGSTEYGRQRVGFSTEMKPEVLTRTGLNEAVTHHVTLGILSGDFETVDPDKRGDKDNTYYGYRKVFAEFIGRSQGVIDMTTVTRAFFEDTGPEGGIQARRQLVREVLQAYGPGSLNKLNKLMDLTDIIGNNRFDEVIFSRIHPPELDDQGHVLKPGYIDTENLPTIYNLYKTPHEPQGNIL
jgi:hypothetical protein